MRRGDVRGGTLWSIGHTPWRLDRMRSGGASAADGSAADAAALRAWGAARDAVLRGLVHALSNRVGTVVAAGALLDGGSAEAAGRVLRGEGDRLELLLAHFRLVTADPFGEDAAPEPVVLTDVVGDALALHAYAADASDAGAITATIGGAPPVLASRAGVLHALLVLLAGGASAVRAEPGPEVVRLRVEPAPDAAAAAAARLLTSAGDGAGGALLLPRFGR